MPLLLRVPEPPALGGDTAERIQWLNVLDPRKTAVQRELRRRGLAGYEPTTQATLIALMEKAPPGSAFLDVGAHIGIYSALVAIMCHIHPPRIIALEPTPQTAALARKLARSNGLTFEVLEYAVSDKAGTATLYLSDKAETSNSLNESFRPHAHEVTVDVVTLDSVVDDLALSPHVIKIDVETHERAVLDGSLRTIERFRPWIVVEILDDSDIPLGLTLDRLTSIGYTFYPLIPELEWLPSHPRLGTRAVEGHRDWLLAPEPVDSGIKSRISSWLGTIGRCTADSNAIVPRGSRFAPGWNQRETWLIT